MSRRTGPGGRLRPAPRAHRPINLRAEPAARLGGVGLPVESLATAYEPDLPGYDGLILQDDSLRGLDPDDVDGLAERELEFDHAEAFAAATAATGATAATASANTPRTSELADGPEPSVAMSSGDLPAAIVPSQPQAAPARPYRSAGPDPARLDRRRDESAEAQGGAPDRQPGSERPEGVPGCTSPQLRRFIKSRAYVPMHELRRRFAIEGQDDDVSPIDVQATRIFAGLPMHESRLLGDLIRNGEIGYELSIDPETPIVIGVYSMRPVSRT